MIHIIPAWAGVVLSIVFIGWLIMIILKRTGRRLSETIQDAAEAESRYKKRARSHEEGYNAFLANPNVSQYRKEAFLKKRERRQRERHIGMAAGCTIVLLLSIGLVMLLMWLFP